MRCGLLPFATWALLTAWAACGAAPPPDVGDALAAATRGRGTTRPSWPRTICFANRNMRGWLVEASIGEPSTLVPILAADSASADVCGLLFNGLVKYDKDLRLVGALAERWEILDGGLTILFHLRRDVRWHDGIPFTADDVQFTYEALINPAVGTPYRGDFERVQSVVVLDPWTVKVAYREPFAPGLPSWGMWMMPRHLLAGQDLHTAAFARHPIGTGPYRFRRWRSGDRVELEANPDYFEGPPKIPWWIYRIIPDQATIFLELQTEGVDYAGLTPLQYRRQTTTPFFRAHYQRFRYPAFGYTYLGYNLRLPMFQDVRVRQALNLSIDKEELVRGVLMGLGRVATGPFAPDSWANDPAIRPTPHDPARAGRLLAEAGWRDHDGDGWLDRDGQRFTFTILTNQGNLPRELAAQLIQRRLKDLGMDVRIRVLEWSSLLNQFIHTRQFEAILLGWGLSPEPDPYDIWHSSKTRAGEFNFVGFSDPTVDRLLDAARRTFSQPERAACYHEIHRILDEQQPYCFLFVADALPILHARVQNVRAAPAGIQYNVVEWAVQ